MTNIRPTLERWYRDFYESWPDDLKAAFVAGCEIEFRSEFTARGLTITARTKNKLGLTRDPGGSNVIYEQRRG